MIIAEEPKTSVALRISEIDGIRGIAILSVVIWHYVAIIPSAMRSDSVLDYATRSLGITWSGVDLFFVLSGFLIGGILLDNRGADNYFKVFYLRRICRIFPLYFLWLGLFLIFSYLIQLPVPSQTAELVFGAPLPLWSYLTFMQNISMAIRNTFGPDWLSITWSLAIEEQFYLTLPLMIRFTPPRRLPYLLGMLIILAPILRVLTLVIAHNPIFSITYQPIALYVLMPYRADALLLGVLSAYLIRQERVRDYLGQHTMLLYGILSILLAGALFLIWRYPSPISWAMITLGYFWLALLYTTFLLIAITEQRGIVKAITNLPVFRYLGFLAYGIYLVHLAMNMLLHGWLRQRPPRLTEPLDLLITLLAFGLTVLLAHLSWQYFEKRFVEIGHRFKYAGGSKLEPHMPEQAAASTK